ncbi:HAD-IA family hydrolase [Ornithinibacillus sp. L9]|uniref:HAD-IA family hydrolase n=1 Tax=Ornithinibacillus caprae TaxID=2678566 RepID=A0A6N8FH78_9BACI|nr:HAD family hydrolase [Ornithinibacillus caprae]MUK89022.1 HAD-IA family hydrolase [Ornithinibacillus caprae]
MMKRWITFDLDGTLMQNPFVEWIFPEIVCTINQQLNQVIDIQELILEEHEIRMKENRIVDAYDWDDIVSKVIEKLNIPIKVDVTQLVKKHAVIPKIYLLENNILTSLNELKKTGYSLAAVTNGYSFYQVPVMKELGLDILFDKVITPDLCGYAKPDERILNQLLDDGEIFAHIGDRIDHDIILANKLGITSVLIHRNLPSNLIEIPFDKRNEDDQLLKLCEVKWRAENRSTAPFVNEGIPNYVISSIEELIIWGQVPCPKAD